jgi:hypothetical protein
MDLELMISLIDSMNPNNIITSEMKTFLKEYLTGTLKNIDPRLAKCLLKLHKEYGYQINNGETITGILTLNYDNLLTKAVSQIFPGYDFPLIYLHGSFEGEDWLPPGIFKNAMEDPKLKENWEKAAYLLSQCDILRIIGSSLRIEDYSLLSLIFSMQIQKGFEIEIINSEEKVQNIWKHYPFLHISLLGMKYSLDNKEETFGKNPYRSWILYLINTISQINQKVLNEPEVKKLIGD